VRIGDAYEEAAEIEMGLRQNVLKMNAQRSTGSYQRRKK
jgi:hypothetical protein